MEVNDIRNKVFLVITQGWGRDFNASWTKAGIHIWKEGHQSATRKKRENLNTQHEQMKAVLLHVNSRKSVFWDFINCEYLNFLVCNF